MPSMLRSSLTRQIILIVFACFLAIEALVLAISAIGERKHILRQAEASVRVTVPALVSSAHAQIARSLINSDDEAIRYPVIGISIDAGYGRTTLFGQSAGLSEYTGSTGRYDRQANHYDFHTSLSAPGSSVVQKIGIRIDTSQLNADLTAYVIKLAGLVLLIGIGVTAATVLALRPILLRPLATLRETMMNARQDDLDAIELSAKEMGRTDEIGDLYQAFDAMLGAIGAAEKTKIEISDRFHGFADLGADCYWETDRRFRFRFITGDVQSVLGTDADSLLGHSFMTMAIADDLPLSEPAMCAMSLRNIGSWQGDLKIIGDETAPRNVRIVSHLIKNKHGFVTGVRGTITDTTAESNLERTLAHQELHDNLTGLMNRAEFERRLNRKMAVLPSVRKPACVIVINLDRFKVINDACGHKAGDQLLRQISEMIQQSVRDTDLLARLDGDTFALLLDPCPLANGLQVCEKIRARISEHRFTWKDEVHSISASIGLAAIDKQVGRNAQTLANADAACFKAKQSGRNKLQVFDAEDETLLRRNDEVQWVSQVTQAIEEDRFVLFYQPIQPVTYKQPGYVHFEVLIRMRTRDDQILPPGAFLPAAERYGLIERIDKWVVGKVLSWLEQQSADPDMPLAVCVNLSGASAADPEFQQFLVDSIKQANVNPAHLCFEMTETAAIHNLAETAVFLQTMRDLGCLIALDDFGTGFSSLEYIKQLPLDYIKIDGAFIRDIVSNQLDQALVRCVADVARHLNVKTVAEFVEDAATLRMLHQLSIDLAQGYFIAKPAPLPLLSELVAQAPQAATEEVSAL